MLRSVFTLFFRSDTTIVRNSICVYIVRCMWNITENTLRTKDVKNKTSKSRVGKNYLRLTWVYYNVSGLSGGDAGEGGEEESWGGFGDHVIFFPPGPFNLKSLCHRTVKQSRFGCAAVALPSPHIPLHRHVVIF